MNNKIGQIAKKTIVDLEEKKITRKAAIKKSAYIAISAATMMLLISKPNKAVATSPAAPRRW